jgi:TRAP-type C4-dicarboxylate transport system permease small subunit
METTEPSESLLERSCRYLAYFGGGLLLATTPVTLASVLSRFFLNRPLMGDFEIVQTAVAACIACFLPYCQIHGDNIIVDFFTTGASKRSQSWMDSFGAVLLASMMLLLGWRGAVGGAGIFQAGETTMLMGIPVWIAYAAIVPGFLLTCLLALIDAGRSMREARGGIAR